MSGELYVEVWSADGATKYGSGPIFEILAARISDQLDRGGDFTLTIAAADERAGLTTQGRELRIYREGEGLIFRGIIEKREWSIID